MGTGDGNAAAPGSYVQDVPHRQSLGPRGETALNQLSQGRAWDKHALVDVEAEAREPGFVGQVGGRNAFPSAPHQQRRQRLFFVVEQVRIEQCLRNLRGQVHGMQHQVERLVERVVGAMAKVQPLFIEQAGPPAHEIA